MTRAADIEAHVHAVDAFARVARALRALAASRQRGARRALAAASDQRQALARALGRLGGSPAIAPGRGDRRLILVLGPEHGFTGALSARLVEAATPLADDGRSSLVLVGARLARLAVESGLRPARTEGLASHPKGALAVANALAALMADPDIGAAVTVAPDPAGQRAVVSPLWPCPVPPIDQGVRPLVQEPEGDVRAAIQGAYDAVLIVERVLTTILAENVQRRARLDAALGGANDRLGHLRRELALARQEAITAELGDLIGGMMAVIEN